MEMLGSFFTLSDLHTDTDRAPNVSRETTAFVPLCACVRRRNGSHVCWQSERQPEWLMSSHIMCHGEERVTGQFLEKQLKKGGTGRGQAEQTDGPGVYFVEGRHKIFPKYRQNGVEMRWKRSWGRRMGDKTWQLGIFVILLSFCQSVHLFPSHLK